MDSKEILLKIKKDLDKFIEENYEPEIYLEECMVCGSARPCYAAEDRVANRKLDDVLKHVNDTFQEAMFYHIDSKHLDEVQVYNDAHIDRRLFSKIRSNRNFKPSRKTAICLCIGLKLNLDETKDLLEKAGYTLSHSSRADLIIEYFIEIKEYNLSNLNDVLYAYGEEILYL